MGGRIDVYLDLASVYSYVALALLRRDAPLYAAHGVEVVYHPVLLGAINQASSNQSPIMNAAKRRYGVHDVRRSCARAGLPDVRPPPDFLARAKTLLPLRALHHIQQHYPPDVFVAAFLGLFRRFWTPPDPADLRDPDVLRAALAQVVADGPSPHAGAPLFAPAEAAAIVAAAAAQPAKDRLAAATQQAIAQGAFGTPWLWVRNDAGREEPFFGSDRFHFVYQFLGLPYQDVALLEPAGSSPKL